MSPPAQRAVRPGEEPLLRVFALLFGAFLGLAFLKFGNPPVMEKFVTAPANIYEFLLGSPWPISWAYKLFVLVAIPGLVLARWNRARPRWLLVLPLAWLAWQVVAASQSLDPALSWPTVAHFMVCAVCFYLGYFSLSRVPGLTFFWLPLLAAFLIILASGWDQHFGGLEATRKYFWTYLYPTMTSVPPEYLKKLSSNRIFSTLFYPNSLAGALLLLLPVMLGFLANARQALTDAARGFLVICVGLAALACLFWSGSKGGWLLMLLVGVLVLFRAPLAKSYKLGLICAVLLTGIAGFVWTYSRYLEKGATSISARFDYWHAAVATIRAHPLLGTGPGTFAIPYSEIKKPEAEMARLTHNDYLEQGSDSGIPGLVAYVVFIAGALVLSCPWSGKGLGTSMSEEETEKGASLRSMKQREGAGETPALLWIGLLAWVLQSCIEFDLYIPALAWTAFTFLGLLLGRRGTVAQD